MQAIVHLLITLLDIYLWVIIASIVVSWLTVFGVLNTRNKWVYQGVALMNRATEPAFRWLRRFIPPIGGIDLSPMVLIFGIYLLQSLLFNLTR